jgi:hypothetical protein
MMRPVSSASATNSIGAANPRVACSGGFASLALTVKVPARPP